MFCGYIFNYIVFLVRGFGDSMNTIEIELRYEVLDPVNLATFLAPLELLHKKHDIDLYFDTPDHQHFGRGLYIRVRNGKKLEIKFNRACLENPDLPHQDFCEEHGFALPLVAGDLGRLNDLLSSIGLKSIHKPDFELCKTVNNLELSYTVDKIRTSYQDKAFTLAVDEVAGLGLFLEIELMARDSDDLERVKQNMRAALAGVNLRQSIGGYSTLIMRKNNFERYLRGRFVLEADRHLVSA